jgi:predicted unusual protein kinase regulating ubiquinone biosynthesis (AarF/ABC1/UbiB family)
MARLASLSAKVSTDVGARWVGRIAQGRGERAARSLIDVETAEKIVSTLGELKGLAMKLGQTLAMEPELLTPDVRAVIAKLHNEAPPMPFTTVRAVVESELGNGLETLFASFEAEPVAAASLGQVHRAVTKTGDLVAVKVQYPAIAQALEADLLNLNLLVGVLTATARMPHGKAYFRELQSSMLEELDYRVEADRSKAYARAARAFRDLRIPRVHDRLTSERVLTTEFLEGMSLKDFLRTLPAHSNDERFRVSRLLMQALWGPFLSEGLLHADPHPGNFLVLDNGTLGVLDFGAIKQASDRWTHANRLLFDAMLGGRPYDCIADSLNAGMVFDDGAKARPLVQAVLDITARPSTADPFDYARASIHRDMRNFFVRHPTTLRIIKPPAEAVQFFRAVAGMNQNLENIGASGPFRSAFVDAFTIAKRHGRRLNDIW